MANPRSVVMLLSRSLRGSVGCSHILIKTAPRRAAIASQFAKVTHSRLYSQELKPSKIYFFQDIKSLSESAATEKVLIDSREPSELQSTGTIPNAVNIPVTSQPDAFFISAEEFEDRFGFERPDQEREVIFYCKSGVRSRAAAELARRAGWKSVGEYPGSWLDWVENGGAKQGGTS